MSGYGLPLSGAKPVPPLSRDSFLNEHVYFDFDSDALGAYELVPEAMGDNLAVFVPSPDERPPAILLRPAASLPAWPRSGSSKSCGAGSRPVCRPAEEAGGGALTGRFLAFPWPGRYTASLSVVA